MLALAVLAGALVYSAGRRWASIPPDLRHVPAESRVVVATGEIEALWTAVSDHFLARSDSGAPSPLAAYLDELADQLASDGRPVRSLDDLAGHGVDVSGGVLLALLADGTFLVSRPVELSRFVMVVPVTDYGRFLDFLDPQGEREVVPHRGGSAEGDGPTTHEIDGWFVIPGDDGTAVVASSADLLARSQENAAENLAYFRSNDLLYGGIRRLHRRPLLEGPTLYAWVQPQVEQSLRGVVASLGFHPERVSLRAEIDLAGGEVRLVDDLLTAPPALPPWEDVVPATVGGALVLTDETMERYVRFLPGERDALPDWLEPFHPVLEEFGGVEGVDRLTLAVVGYDRGLPEAVLAARGPPQALDTLVRRTRLRLQAARDLRLLNEARRAWIDPADAFAAPAPNDLVAGGALRPEARWALYQAEDEGFARIASTPPEEPFPASEYERREGSRVVRYLAPPATENDILYTAGLDTLDRDFILGDRYRLASLVEDGVLWMAADADLLLDRVDQAPPATPPLAHAGLFRSVPSAGGRRSKVDLFLDVDRLVDLGLLSDESDVRDAMRGVLLQLRNHPAVRLQVWGAGSERLRVEVNAVRTVP